MTDSQIASIPRTTREEEISLAGRGPAAVARLVEGNLWALVPIARALGRKACGRWSAEDLLNEGVVAVSRGAVRWKPRERFANYARVRARGAMKDFLRRKSEVVRNSGEAAVSLDAFTYEVRPAAGAEVPELEEVPEFEEVLAGLPLKLRRVLEVTVFAEVPRDPVAAAAELGLLPRTVAGRILAGMGRLLAEARQLKG